MDPFKFRYQKLYEANQKVLSLPSFELQIHITDVGLAIEQMCKGEHLPSIAIDEAQVIIPFLHGKFVSHVPPFEDRALATPILKALLDPATSLYKHKVAYCGTGLALHFRSVELSSAVAKPIPVDPVFREFGGRTEAEQMVKWNSWNR